MSPGVSRVRLRLKLEQGGKNRGDLECERVGVGAQGGEGLQGWGTVEWWQTSPNWHLTFFCHWHWSGPAFKPSLGPCWKSALCKYGEWAPL